jgi:hypothetical protein
MAEIAKNSMTYSSKDPGLEISPMFLIQLLLCSSWEIGLFLNLADLKRLGAISLGATLEANWPPRMGYSCHHQ